MKKLFTLVVIAVALFASSQLFGQTNVYLNLSGVVPTGDFADGDEDGWGLITEDKEGGAGFGLNVGMKFNIATGVNGLRAMITMDAIYNGLNSELRDLFEDEVDDAEDAYKDYSLKTPKHINVPIMGGVNYTYNFNDKLGLFAEAGVGADFHLITKMEEYIETSSYKRTSTIEYDPQISMAYMFGAGVELSKRVTVGIDYYNLGKAKVKGEESYKVKYTDGGSNSDSDKFSLKRINPTMVMLRVGFKL